MARQINRLTALDVKSGIKTKGMYPDGAGLYLRVSETGTKGWIFRFSLNKKSREMGLGRFPDVSLAEARNEAERCRKLAKKGIDPIDDREKQLAAAASQHARVMTFKDCAEAFIESQSAEWKNAKHRAQWPSTMKMYVYPVFGDTPVDEVNIGLVMQVLEPIWTTKTETARRVRGRIEAIIDWAIAYEYRSGSNPARWKGRLDKLLPKQSKIRKVRHHPALQYDDMHNFMLKLREQNSVSARGLEFLILTATRTGEVMGATWNEFDLKEAVWTVPEERMKAEKEHRVPLSTDALAVLKQMQELKVSDYVFPGQSANRPLSNMAFLKALERMGHGDITAHGFRSTFRDWSSERTGYSNEVKEMALAHVINNKAEAAYRRGDLLEKRRQLMQDWADFCSMPPAEGNVVPIAR